MALTEQELKWLNNTVTKTRNALRSKGMSSKLSETRPPVLTPNAALITFQGDDSLTVKKLTVAESELLTTYAIPIQAITQGIGTISIAVQRNPRAILKSKAIFSEILKDPGYDKSSEDVFVGVREEDGQPQFMDLFSDPHTLVSGTTGSGKSVLLQNIIIYIGLTRTADDAHIYLVDGKDGVDYGALVELPHLKNGCGEIVTTKENSINLIVELQEEMERRYALFKSTGTNNLKSYREKTGEKLPTIFYIQDEFAAWMLDKEYSDAISSGVSSIGVKARAAGIFLFFGLQRPDNTVVPMQLRDQLGNRLTLKVSDSGTAQIATQEKNSGAEKLLGKGHMLAKIGGQMIPIQVPYIDPDSEMRPLVKMIAAKYLKEQQESSIGIIYADVNASTRVDSEVVSAMAPYWNRKFYNPSSPAGAKFGAEHPVQMATVRLSETLGGEHTSYFLTSGATEANNWAIDQAIKRALKTRNSCHLIISEIEHLSVLETARHSAEQDTRIILDVIKVTPNGVINIEDLKSKLKADTDFVSVMLANNESGVIQPLKEISSLVKKIAPACLVHTDGTQAIGKIAVDLDNDLSQVDLFSLSAHKFGGPKGIGALFIRDIQRATAFLVGGSQQNGMRGGTENPPLAAGMVKALETFKPLNIAERRDHFEKLILTEIPELKILGKKSIRLPNTSLIVHPSIDGEHIQLMLLEMDIIVSTGAACSAGTDTPSHVVTAMGVDYSVAKNAVRFSFDSDFNEQKIIRIIEAITHL